MEPAQAIQETQEVTANDYTQDVLARFEQHEQKAVEAKKEPAPTPELVKEEPAAKPEKVEEAEKTDPKATEEKDETPKTTAAAGKVIAEMKKELKELRSSRESTTKAEAERLKEIETLKAKIGEYEGKMADLPKYEEKIKTYESELAEHNKYRAVHDVENSKPYIEEVLKPAQEIGDAIIQLASLYETSPESLKELLMIKDPAQQRKKINELTTDWNAADVVELHQHARNSKALLAKSDAMLANAEKTRDELKFIAQEEGKRKTEQESRNLKAAQDAVEKQLFEKFGVLNEDEELAEKVRSAIHDESPTLKILGAKLMPLVRALNDKYITSKSRITELEEELSKRMSAKAAPGGAAATTTTKAESNLPQGNTPEDALARWNAMQANGA